MIRFLFKTPEHRRFEFKPRYYNESKEDLEKRKAAIRRELNPDQEAGGDVMRHRIDRAWVANHRQKSTFSSNRNIMIIAAILLILSYLFLK